MNNLITKQTKFELNNFKQFNVSSKGQVKINFINSNIQKIICKSYSQFHNVEVSDNEIKLINMYENKIDYSELHRTKDSLEKKESILNILSSFSNDVIDLVKSKSRNGTEQQEDILEVDLYLNENVSLDFSGESYEFSISSSKFSNIVALCDNMHWVGENYTINALRIDSGNISGDFLFNENNANVSLKAENGNIKLIKKDFNGTVSIKAENLKIEGLELTNSISDYIFSCKFENAMIKVV